MREDWTETSLGEVAEWYSGGTPKAGEPEFYEGGDIPWVVIADLLKTEIYETATHITSAGLSEIGGRLAPVGSVLISMYATVGRPGITHLPVATNQAIAWSIPNTDVIEPRFLLLVAQHLEDEISSMARGATQRNINRAMLREFAFLLPPLREQRRIVDLMSSVDSYIAALQQHMEVARVLRSAIEVAEFDNPENELSLLGDYCDKTDIQVGPFGSQLHQREYVADGIPVVMPKDIIDGRISGRTIARVTPEKASELKRHLLIPGDVLFARRGDLSKRALVNETQAGWLCGTGTVRVRSGKLNGEILFRLSNTSNVNSWLMDNSVGATMPNLNSSIVAAIPLRVPGNALEAVALLRAMDKFISGTTDLLSSATELRSGLLSDLLSGAHEIPESYDRLLGAA